VRIGWEDNRPRDDDQRQDDAAPQGASSTLPASTANGVALDPVTAL
jgi:hypothetical protein